MLCFGSAISCLILFLDYCECNIQKDPCKQACGGTKVTTNAIVTSPTLCFGAAISCLILFRITVNARIQPRFRYASSRSFLHSNELQYTKRPLQASLRGPLYTAIRSNPYLFENCGARRAPLRPYFLRSFIRGSRVR